MIILVAWILDTRYTDSIEEKKKKKKKKKKEKNLHAHCK